MGLKTMRLPSGAGHDAQQIARLGPMGMIFVPSVGGISHSPKELTTLGRLRQRRERPAEDRAGPRSARQRLDIRHDRGRLLRVARHRCQRGHAELRRAWRRLALQWHPDRAGEGATATFQKIQAAYAVLSDPISRAAYDRRQRRVARAARPYAGGHVLAAEREYQGLLACGFARRAPGDIIELYLNADEAVTGGMISSRCACRCAARLPGNAGAVREVWRKASARRSVRRVAGRAAGVQDGEILPPSALLPGMINRVLFRVRLANQ